MDIHFYDHREHYVCNISLKGNYIIGYLKEISGLENDQKLSVVLELNRFFGAFGILIFFVLFNTLDLFAIILLIVSGN